jgi:hypothetical protein
LTAAALSKAYKNEKYADLTLGIVLVRLVIVDKREVSTVAE